MMERTYLGLYRDPIKNTKRIVAYLTLNMYDTIFDPNHGNGQLRTDNIITLLSLSEAPILTSKNFVSTESSSDNVKIPV